MSNFVGKLQIFLKSRKIFKNWQIYPKIYFKLSKEKFLIFETREGMKIKIRTNSTDLMALTNVWMINEYNMESYEIKKNDIIIDVGSHIGLFSLLASKFCTEGKIFSYEPVKDNFECFISNLNLNQIKHIFPFNLAVSSDSSKLDLFLNEDESGHSIFSQNDKKISVNSISLKEIFDKNNISICKLLKLDCEGSEYSIIDALPIEYFKRIENIVIEYHLADSRPEYAEKLITKIKNAGFQIETKPHYNDMGFLIARK
tara:strand:+ start:1107 stop:1877 length:771 start_codon:yes stop_codon:yes gene_type:complete